VYLLKEKSKVESMFKTSFEMAETQFQQTMQTFKSDKVERILQRTSLKEKNTHMLEVSRALLF